MCLAQVLSTATRFHTTPFYHTDPTAGAPFGTTHHWFRSTGSCALIPRPRAQLQPQAQERDVFEVYGCVPRSPSNFESVFGGILQSKTFPTRQRTPDSDQVRASCVPWKFAVQNCKLRALKHKSKSKNSSPRTQDTFSEVAVGRPTTDPGWR